MGGQSVITFIGKADKTSPRKNRSLNGKSVQKDNPLRTGASWQKSCAGLSFFLKRREERPQICYRMHLTIDQTGMK